jgi:tetraacyldisaccharide 4'-kinase
VAITGDEARVIVRNVSVPLMLGRNRREAVRSLIEDHACNVVLSDDGLQHYALQRDLEILMVDGQRRFGNGWLLPAGPLREPMNRTRCCDFHVVVQGPAKTGEYELFIRPLHFVDINDEHNILPLEAFRDARVHAVGGIGNPGRFFDGLRQNHIHCIEHAFNDHHRYEAADFDFSPNAPIVMTEKDAVKCTDIQLANAWYMASEPVLSSAFEIEFDQQMEKIASKYG